MDNDKQLVVPATNAMLAMMQQEADDRVQLAQELEGAGYTSAYIRAQRTSTQDPQRKKHGVGALEIRFSREDIIYPRYAAVLLGDIIGTKGFNDSKNPTPRKWLVPYNDNDVIERFGYTYCQSTDGVHPDSASFNPAVEPIHGRTLVHPDANGRQSVVVRDGYRGDKDITVYTAQEITENTLCADCIFRQAWWASDAPEGAPPVLNTTCLPNPAAVFYLLGAEGFNDFSADRRVWAQVQMYKQATRTMFGRSASHADTEYQKQVGVFAPMADIINAKMVDGLPPNAVLVEGSNEEENVIFYFPYLLGAIVHPEKVGASNHLFLFNPATVVREYLRTSSEPIEMRMSKAVKNAASTFFAKIGTAGDATAELSNIESLLRKTILTSFSPDHAAIYAEYRKAWEEYHRVVDGQKVGRKALTTPFQRETVDRSDHEQAHTTNAEAVQTPVAPVTATSPEVDAQVLQALNNTSDFTFQPEVIEADVVEDDDIEGPVTNFFTPPGWTQSD